MQEPIDPLKQLPTSHESSKLTTPPRTNADYNELSKKPKGELLVLYGALREKYVLPSYNRNTPKDDVIVALQEALRKERLGELQPVFHFTEDFQPLDIVEDRSIEQRILDGDLTMATVKSKRMVLYAQVSFDQIVYLSYNAIGTRRGDRHTVLTRYHEIHQKVGQEVEIHEVALPLITKVALST